MLVGLHFMCDLLNVFPVRMEVTLVLGCWDFCSYRTPFALKGLSSPLLWPEEALRRWLPQTSSRPTSPLKRHTAHVFSTLYIKGSVRKWTLQCQTGWYMQWWPPLLIVSLVWGWVTSVILWHWGRQFLWGSQVKIGNGFAQQQSPCYSLVSSVLEEVVGKYQNFEFQNTNGKYLGYSKPMLSVTEEL